MNKCWVIGKILDEPEYKFLYKSKNNSISYFKIKLKDNNVIDVFGYDDMADYIYRNLKKDDDVLIEGYLHSNRGKINLISITIEVIK